MRRRWAGLVVAILVLGCGGGGGGGKRVVTVPEATAAQIAAQGLLAEIVGSVSAIGDLLPLFSNPDAAAAAGLELVLDTSEGAAPNTYSIRIPFDVDENGANDTEISGTAVFSSNPLDPLTPGFTATLDLHGGPIGEPATLTLTADVTLGVAGAVVAFDGSLVDEDAGREIAFATPPGEPLELSAPEEGETANLCTLNANGPVGITVTSLSGLYQTLWRFVRGSNRIAVEASSFTPAAGEPTELTDTSFTAPACPASGSIDDWVATWAFDWSCLPPESGSSRLTIVKTSPTTVRITDEAPPGSGDFITYDATVDPADPHVLHGTFSETDDGGTYSENFTWRLSPDGSTWMQESTYLYSSGPLEGTGGVCSGTAVREN